MNTCYFVVFLIFSFWEMNKYDFYCNNFGLEGRKALADALCKNVTLIFLNLCRNNLGLKDGKG